MACLVKFCGLRTPADVETAVACGVAAVGFVLTASPRAVSPAACRELRKLVPPGVRVHGVFAGETPEEIRALVTDCRLDVAQIHGRETDDAFWTALADTPTIRACQVRGPETLALLDAVRGQPFLLDAYRPGVAGGTGTTFDWTLARAASGLGRLILAGGLTPENVGDAIRAATPWMVDVSGGVERERGVKSPERMRAFAAAVRAAAGPAR